MPRAAVTSSSPSGLCIGTHTRTFAPSGNVVDDLEWRKEALAKSALPAGGADRLCASPRQTGGGACQHGHASRVTVDSPSSPFNLRTAPPAPPPFASDGWSVRRSRQLNGR